MNHKSSSASRPASSSLALELRFADEEKSLRILLAEDSHELRRLLSFVLRREGHEVVEVQDGSSLLETLAFSIVEGGRQPFDLVICEQQLPGMPGLAVLTACAHAIARCPVILISSNACHPGSGAPAGGVGSEPAADVEAIHRVVRESEDEWPEDAPAVAVGQP